MYTVSRSSAGVCVIINSKCCSPQIKASGFSTKHSALISPKQVSVRYRLSFTLLSSSPPLSSVPPPHPQLTSACLPLILSLLKREGVRERKRGGGEWRESRRGVGDEEREGRCEEAKSKLKTRFSNKTTASGMLRLEKQVCVCPDATVYSKLSIYTSKLKGH